MEKPTNKPILLVDCDGVLADLTLLINSLNKILKTSVDLQECDQYHLHEIWQTTPDVMDRAMDDIESFFSYEDVEPVVNAVASIDKLGKIFDIKVLTARKPKHEQQTYRWIKKYFGPKVEIIYAKAKANHHGNNAPITKIEICQKLAAFALIEDNPYELEELATKAPGVLPICLELPFNRRLKNNSKIFVGDWKTITPFLLAEYTKKFGSK